MPRGGYQKPEHPAAVSGPGALSARTDGGATQAGRDIPDAKYGENKDFREIQGSAPLAGGGPSSAPMVPFGAPTTRPDEPVTAGAAAGAGPGPAAAGIAPSLDQADYENMRHLLPSLELLANQPNANPTTRAFVRRLKSQGI